MKEVCVTVRSWYVYPEVDSILEIQCRNARRSFTDYLAIDKTLTHWLLPKSLTGCGGLVRSRYLFSPSSSFARPGRESNEIKWKSRLDSSREEMQARQGGREEKRRRGKKKNFLLVSFVRQSKKCRRRRRRRFNFHSLIISFLLPLFALRYHINLLRWSQPDGRTDGQTDTAGKGVVIHPGYD